MMLIIVKKETHRLHYIMQLMLKSLLGIDFRFTCNKVEFGEYVGPKFSYGVDVEEQFLYFAADGLLFENKIIAKDLKHIDYKGNLVFFPVHNMFSALPFDPFAAAFYLVSRYEEYLPHLRDEHNRFLASGSCAFQNGYLDKPVVNVWSLLIKDVLSKRFPELVFKSPVYEFVPTFDIDSAFAFKNKGLTRAMGGILKAIKDKKVEEVKQRVRVIMGIEKDPFDTFGLQMELQTKYGYSPIYFILLADYGPNDKNVPYNNRKFRYLIRYLADYAEIGIHPSYASSLDPSLIEMETARLSKMLKKEVEHSRQHYLKLVLPDTYRNLINNDIVNDYTMGYAEVPGFRASICTPFPFFDLDQDTATPLIIHPFAVMDGTLFNYMKLAPELAIGIIEKLINEVKSVGGTFIPLWHNQTLNDDGEWKGWLNVYVKMAEMAVE